MKNIFRKLSANESLIMACLQIYQELSNLPTFLRVHSNLKEVSYLLIKYVSSLENYLSYQAKCFFVNLTPKELTPCKISHICRCAFKSTTSFEIFIVS